MFLFVIYCLFILLFNICCFIVYVSFYISLFDICVVDCLLFFAWFLYICICC